MSLEVERRSGRGITVPYAPIYDQIRRNSGFVDTRGRPDIAEQIAEGSQSSALRSLLVRVASEGRYFSLGCDLGQHSEDEAQPALQQVAGGYVQVTGIHYATLSTDHYDKFFAKVERKMRGRSNGHAWRLWFEGCFVNFKLNGETEVTVPSAWIWFFARARTVQAASRGRETMIAELSNVLHDSAVANTLTQSR